MATYYCKICGRSANDLKILLSSPCMKSPTKRHVAFEGKISREYHCKYCGAKATSINILVTKPCIKSPTKKHQPYEGM